MEIYDNQLCIVVLFLIGLLKGIYHARLYYWSVFVSYYISAIPILPRPQQLPVRLEWRPRHKEYYYSYYASQACARSPSNSYQKKGLEWWKWLGYHTVIRSQNHSSHSGPSLLVFFLISGSDRSSAPGHYW